MTDKTERRKSTIYIPKDKGHKQANVADAKPPPSTTSEPDAPSIPTTTSETIKHTDLRRELLHPGGLFNSKKPRFNPTFDTFTRQDSEPSNSQETSSATDLTNAADANASIPVTEKPQLNRTRQEPTKQIVQPSTSETTKHTDLRRELLHPEGPFNSKKSRFNPTFETFTRQDSEPSNPQETSSATNPTNAADANASIPVTEKPQLNRTRQEPTKQIVQPSTKVISGSNEPTILLGKISELSENFDSRTIEFHKQMLIYTVNKKIEEQNAILGRMLDLSINKNNLLTHTEKLAEWIKIREELNSFEEKITSLIKNVEDEMSNSRYNLVTLEEKKELIETIRPKYMKDNESLKQKVESQILRYTSANTNDPPPIEKRR